MINESKYKLIENKTGNTGYSNVKLVLKENLD